MPTLNIGGQKVTVGDSFMGLTPDQQNATVDEIAKSLKPSAPASSAMTGIGGDTTGLITPGNIDLAHRPKVKNADGSISTVRSMSFNEDGREVLVPTVSPDGRILSDQDAIDLYHKTGQSLGTFDTPENATKYAERLHQQQEQMYAEPSKAYSGSFLPLSRDEQGNISFDSNAGVVGAVKRAFTAPGRAMSGELQVMGPDGNVSPEAIGEGFNFASVFAPASPAAGTGKAIAANAAREAGQVVKPGMEAAGAAERLGVDLPRAVASDSATVQQGGKILTSVPLGGNPLRNASRQAIEQLGQAADNVQASAGSGSAAAAGGLAREGIKGYGKALSQRVSDAYNGVDGLITQNVTTPLTETGKIALEIGTRRANAKLPESSAVARVSEALKAPEGLNYQGIKDLRTSVGELLDNPQSIVASGVSEAELKRIYGGLTSDLKSAVARSGGEKASQAFEAANQLAAKTAREREGLQKVLGNDLSDERLFDRITAMAGSNARADRVSLARVRGAVSDGTWNEIASGVIAKLGRDADGAFSPDRFISGYGKISAEGKQALFGTGDLAKSLDDIATVSRRFKQLNQYANPSGTGQTVLGGALIPGLYAEPVTTISSVVGARVLSSLLAKPVSAKALAAYSRAYEQHATNPSQASLRALENTSRAVSALIANQAGDKGLAAQIFPSISRVQQVPADQGNENQGVNEGQNGGVSEQPRYVSPNEL